MLDELAVCYPEDVDTDVAIRTYEAGPMRVDSDNIAVSDDAADVALGVGEGFEETVDVGPQALDTVLGGGSMLDVSFADIACNGTINVAVEMSLLIESEHDLLVLFGDGLSRHVDFQSYSVLTALAVQMKS